MAGTRIETALSKQCTHSLIKISVANGVHLFTKSATGPNFDSYKCIKCRDLKEREGVQGQVPIIHVLDGIHLDDPLNLNRPHLCEPIPEGEFLGQQHQRQTYLDIERTRNRPLQAYRKPLANLNRTHGTLAARQIQQNVNSYKSNKRQLYRHLNKSIPVVNRIFDIRGHHYLTFEDRYLLPEDRPEPWDPTPYIIFAEEYETANPNENNKMVIFSSAENLDVLHDSEHIICDGTFDFCPKGFDQIYAIIGFVHGESHCCAVGLLPNRQRLTYDAFFEQIQQALWDRHGNLGRLQHASANFDFELQAQDSYRAHFPDGRVWGCVFHFRKALWTNVQAKGFASEYRNGAIPAINDWVTRIMSLCLYPPQYVRWLWDNFLRDPPIVQDETLQRKLFQFQAYVERYWMQTQDFILRWNHWNNVGPRTDNHVEGWNRSLSELLSAKHMLFGKFLEEFQEFHHCSILRLRGVQEERYDPKPRNPRYVDNDRRIVERKINFTNLIENFIGGYFEGNNQIEYFIRISIEHLDAMRHNLGLNNGNNAANNANIVVVDIM